MIIAVTQIYEEAPETDAYILDTSKILNNKLKLDLETEEYVQWDNDDYKDLTNSAVVKPPILVERVVIVYLKF